ncbi:glutamate decarboxylase [Bacillota bacterium LX-D]|nr:glutamate decarboxylase [Bacillota bacterium LX-D]
MWTVVYIASNRQIAEKLKDTLTNEGLLATVKAVGSPQVGDAGAFEILVPESEAEEANEIISQVLAS